MKKFRLKNYTALKIKIFNFNRLIVLLISGIIIFCIRYYLNYFGYVTDISLIFIFLCVLLKSIIQAIVEYIREPNLIIKNGKSNDKILIIMIILVLINILMLIFILMLILII